MAVIMAVRQGTRPIKVEQQITELALDQTARWIARVQNDRQTKMRGRVKVTMRAVCKSADNKLV